MEETHLKSRVNETKFQIQWGDTDRAGIVYYPNYYKWFDLAGHNFFRSIEMSPKYLEEEKRIIIPLLEAKCTFEKPLYYDDEVIVYTHVNEVKTKTFRFQHEVYCREIRAGYGYEIRAWTSIEDDGFKAVPIPENIKRILKVI
ncbi:acyl-CoA thioesterase [Peribacillus frigoritolerans]|uniref:acyl-CoA thioesterase n=1 Tax=Peribacillus frigoritolerans TaxID=450367 RepID=UPI003CFCBE23